MISDGVLWNSIKADEVNDIQLISIKSVTFYGIPWNSLKFIEHIWNSLAFKEIQCDSMNKQWCAMKFNEMGGPSMESARLMGRLTHGWPTGQLAGQPACSSSHPISVAKPGTNQKNKKQIFRRSQHWAPHLHYPKYFCFFRLFGFPGLVFCGIQRRHRKRQQRTLNKQGSGEFSTELHTCILPNTVFVCVCFLVSPLARRWGRT